MANGFTIKKYDKSCLSRLGSLCIENYRIELPILWLGYSLKSSVNIGDYFNSTKQPILISFGDVVDRETLKERIIQSGIHNHIGHFGPILGDSGGYKLMTNLNTSFSTKELTDFYKKSNINLGVSLDYPFSFEIETQTNLSRWTKTVDNFRILVDEIDSIPIIPVIHGYSLIQIEEACKDVRSVTDKPLMLGLGGLVPLIKSSYIGNKFVYRRNNGEIGHQISFIADAIEIIKSYFPNSLLHAFGAGGSTTILPMFALGIDSVDSIAWRIKASFGAIVLPGSSDRFLSQKNNSSKKRKLISGIECDLLDNCKCPICVKAKSYEEKVFLLDNNFRERAIHNAWVTLKDINEFKKAVSEDQGKKYLERILTPRNKFHWIIHTCL
jgi:7-cyano-7-deazaguanine tRNA-ribosyltransferase